MACMIGLIDPTKEKIIKNLGIDSTYAEAEKKVEQLNADLNRNPNKKRLYWKVINIGI